MLIRRGRNAIANEKAWILVNLWACQWLTWAKTWDATTSEKSVCWTGRVFHWIFWRLISCITLARCRMAALERKQSTEEFVSLLEYPELYSQSCICVGCLCLYSHTEIPIEYLHFPPTVTISRPVMQLSQSDSLSVAWLMIHFWL